MFLLWSSMGERTMNKELRMRKKIIKLNKEIEELTKQRDIEIEYLYKYLEER